MKKLVVIALSLIMSVGVLACGANKETNTTEIMSEEVTQNEKVEMISELVNEEEQVLRIGAREIAADLDPVVPIVADYLVNMGAAELLFKVDEEGVPQPLLADGAEQVNTTEWIITLKEDIIFWSGKIVDADAVIASLERSRELDLKAQPFIEMMTFEKIDDTSIRVTTSQPDIDVPLNLSYFQLVIHNVEMDFDSVETMDLTGMYQVVEYVPAEKMVLEKNENYWGEKPVIQTVIHEQIGDDQARVAAALSGEYQVVMNIPMSSVVQFEGSNVAEISSSEVTNSETIYMNLQKEKFQDERVRQALSWALDRDELIALGAEGYGKSLTTWLGSNPAYSEIRNAVYDTCDREKAAELLDEAGWILDSDGLRKKDGETLSIHLMTWGVDQALGEAIQAQWTEIGIDAQVQYGDYSLIEAAREQGNWDAFIEAWTTFGDVTALLKGQYSTTGGGNYGGYDDEVTNELFSKISKAETRAEREELIKELSVHVAEQAPVICLYPRPEFTAVSKQLEGFTPHFRQFENVVNANLRIKES